MKILVKIHQSPEENYLVELSDKSVIRRVKRLVNKGMRSNAIVAAFLNSDTMRELSAEELPNAQADMVITEKNIHLDLC